MADKYPAPANLDALLNRFKTHPITTEQGVRLAALRSVWQDAVTFLVANTPPSREQSLALTHLEEASMWAVKAVTHNETPAVKCDRCDNDRVPGLVLCQSCYTTIYPLEAK